MVAVVPDHICTPANLTDELLVNRDGGMIDRWQIAARGANT
jgi:D-serine deaminase-like pyridoxal phosphate-dependent protein